MKNVIQHHFFGDIEKRRKSLLLLENELDIKDCRVNCRMDEINRYLWRLKNPHLHENFI